MTRILIRVIRVQVMASCLCPYRRLVKVVRLGVVVSVAAAVAHVAVPQVAPREAAVAHVAPVAI
jgi:hypothetical protein